MLLQHDKVHWISVSNWCISPITRAVVIICISIATGRSGQGPRLLRVVLEERRSWRRDALGPSLPHSSRVGWHRRFVSPPELFPSRKKLLKHFFFPSFFLTR